MKIIKSLPEWQAIRKELGNQFSIGFTATMGNLHQGHASLLKKSKEENQLSVLSIYINPIQFNQQSDYENYPRTLEQDLELADNHQTDFILIPKTEEIYADEKNFTIHTNHSIGKIMEGLYRPNHFNGMLTIVLKLLMLVKPTNAYFGEKDFQQLKLIEEMVKAFFIDTQIISCPTVREASGLALSSRNHRLSPSQKQQAELINQIIKKDLPCEIIKQELEKEGFIIDYVEEFANRIHTAVKIEDIRLIDNLPVFTHKT